MASGAQDYVWRWHFVLHSHAQSIVNDGVGEVTWLGIKAHNIYVPGGKDMCVPNSLFVSCFLEANIPILSHESKQYKYQKHFPDSLNSLFQGYSGWGICLMLVSIKPIITLSVYECKFYFGYVIIVSSCHKLLSTHGAARDPSLNSVIHGIILWIE
jgi:hypothetical protein